MPKAYPHWAGFDELGSRCCSLPKFPHTDGGPSPSVVSVPCESDEDRKEPTDHGHDAKSDPLVH
jgi:hypothetical protein